MEKVNLSLTIVAYKNYNDIKMALNSIEKYTDKTIKKKIYIIDNGAKYSLDNEIKEFKNYISNYKDVQYIDTKENLGFGRGHNYIIDNLNSEYHAIVNPDILLIEDSFSSILMYMNKNNDVGMCIPKIIDEDGNLQKVYREEITLWDMIVRFFFKNIFKKRFEHHTMQNKDYTKPFQVPFGQGSFLVVKTELFKELNGFDDRYFMYMEDADLCKRVNQVSKLMYFPNTQVIHKWERGSHKNIKLLKYHIKSMILYFKKWGIKWK